MIKYISDDKINIMRGEGDFDKEELNDLLMNPNTIKEINCYNLSTDNLEYVKYLIELSPYCKDDLITKNIYGNITPEFIKDNYRYPETWNTTYKMKDDKYFLTSLVTHKKFASKLQGILNYLVKAKASPLEIIKVIYDEIKMLPKEKSDSELESFIKGTDNYAVLLTFIFKTMGIRAVTIDDYTFSYVIDSKYDVKGIYLFNPELDSQKREAYEGFLIPLKKASGEVIDAFKNNDMEYIKRNIDHLELELKDYSYLYHGLFNTRDITSMMKNKCLTMFSDMPSF